MIKGANLFVRNQSPRKRKCYYRGPCHAKVPFNLDPADAHSGA